MRRYLVVDDSRTIRLTVVAALKTAGVKAEEIEEAKDEGEARAAWSMSTIDIVFLDMMLGDASGLKLMQEMLEQKPTTKVVLTTGLDREHPDVVRAISDGAFGYLRKPVRAEAVKDVLEQLDAEEGRVGRIR